MTPEQTKTAFDGLNMTRRAAARALNVGERSIRRWQKIGAPDWLPNAIAGLKAKVVQKNGRWVQREQDLGPVIKPAPLFPPVVSGHGCICPPGAEKTCRGAMCPRQPIGTATSAVGATS